jgi:hypothetical protein
MAKNELASVKPTAIVPSDSGQILDIISRVATDPNADIDKMERLMVMYQQVEAMKAEKAFNAALQAVQAEMPSITRDAENKQTKSTYAKLETVNKALIPVYTTHGFSLSFGTGQTAIPDHVLVTCRVSHIGGHTRDYEYASPITMTGIQGNAMMTRAHATGSALSYGRRYLTLLIFNATMADEDDDGNAATEKAEQIKIGPKRLRVIVDGLLRAVEIQDGPGLMQIVDELETEEQMFTWTQLRSWERSAIKNLLSEAREAAAKGEHGDFIAQMDSHQEPQVMD